MTSSEPSECPYASRGGLKLAAGLAHFAIEPAGWRCADLGCSVGGFTDCLLQRGATHVYAVDTAYGELAWPLRQDARVTVLERANALHFEPATELENFAGCDLVTLDLGWTRQAKALPAAQRWLRPEGGAWLITLVKPHYEQPHPTPTKRPRGRCDKRRKRRQGRQAAKSEPMSEDEARAVLERTLTELAPLGFEAVSWCRSPITGSKGGNMEYLALLRVVSRDDA